MRTPYALIIAALCALPLAAQDAAPRALTLTREWVLDPEKENFSRVSWVAVARDQSMVMYAPKDGDLLRIYSARGIFVRSLARTGEGPGELNGLPPAWGWVGDTLWLGEFNSHRLIYLGPDQRVIRTTRYPTSFLLRRGGTEHEQPAMTRPPQAVYSNGDLLFNTAVAPSAAGPSFAIAGLTRIGADSVLRMRTARIPDEAAEACLARYRGARNIPTITQRPLCFQQFVRASKDGKRNVILRQDAGVTPGSAAAWHLTVVGERGDTLLRRAYPYRAVAVTAAMRDSAIAALAATRTGEDAALLRAALRTMEAPRTLPPVTNLYLGSEGTILVARSEDRAGEWTMLDGKGEIIGKVALPPRSQIQYVSTSALVAIELDEDDVPSVVRYRIGGGR